MRSLAHFVLSCIVVAGCSPEHSVPAAEASRSAQPAPATPAAAASLPDVESAMASGMCANGPGAEGADSYFTGEFSVTGETVSGTESWVLFANPRWQSRGGNDCRLVWDVTGRVTQPRNCTGCDLGIEFKAVPRLDSDCPEELVQGRKLATGQRVGGEGVPFEQTYSVERRSDGTARVFFGKSGKLLAEGYHAEGRVRWLSAHACKWF